MQGDAPLAPCDLPEYGAAEPGSPLAKLDAARAARIAEQERERAARWAKQEARARAVFLGEADPEPDAPVEASQSPVDEPEPGATHRQTPEEFEQEVNKTRASRFRDWQAGKIEPSTVHRMDVDERTGVFTVRRKARGGEWGKPTYFWPHPATTVLEWRNAGHASSSRVRARPRSSRRRPACCGARRTSAVSRGDPPDGDPDGEPSGHHHDGDALHDEGRGHHHLIRVGVGTLCAASAIGGLTVDCLGCTVRRSS